MIIDIFDDHHFINEENKDLITKLINFAADKIHCHPESEVDISIVNNKEIQQLNKEYRHIDRPTDVLSFALEENLSDAPTYKTDEEIIQDIPIHLGDIIISYPKAYEQAKDYEHSIERELGFLAVHGFLHLNGYDHQNAEDEAIMFGIQEEVLAANGLERP